jgi:peptide/nickel transport system permease protein
MAEAVGSLVTPEAPQTPEASTVPGVEDKISVATQWQLMWWRFRKHRLAMGAAVVIFLFYGVVIFADFLAYSDPLINNADLLLMAPQRIHWFDDDGFNPHVLGFTGKRDPKTFKKVYTPDPDNRVYLELFAEGYEYKLFGFIETNIHLIGAKNAPTQESLFLLGSDKLGRDLYSRLMVATRLSLTIGLAGVVLSLVLGVLLGGLSGLYGGFIDNIIQRIIEIVRSIPTIPLWMALAAAVPATWPIERVYFVIVLILGIIGWTTLARVVRGRFLSLREEDFVIAAELAGANKLRIIFRHMVPSFTSHIIAATTLALPAMIIAETSLSFLGLGLRPPAISWGVLLKDAQNVQAVALSPWLLFAAIPVIVSVLAFNFLGDGLRDAADPYG